MNLLSIENVVSLEDVWKRRELWLCFSGGRPLRRHGSCRHTLPALISLADLPRELLPLLNV